MLRRLDITDILLIDRLTLDFQDGLNVLTGETGAGKSILLDSLGFVLGWRGRADIVRSGAKRGEVTAEFELPAGHPARSFLADQDLVGDYADELILRRTVSAEGRKSAYINDRRAGGDLLRDLSGLLVELHGQQDDKGLLNPRAHLGFLDAAGGIETADTRSAWRRVRQAEKALSAAQEALASAQKDEEYLRHTVRELEDLAPLPGEETELDAKRRLMQGAEKIRDDVMRAAAALGPEAAERHLMDATRWLQGAEADAGDMLTETLAALGRAVTELGEAQAGVERCLGALSHDPLELEQTEERLFAIRTLARKHGCLPDELGDVAQALRARLDAVDEGDANIAGLAADVAAAKAQYGDLADGLSAARKAAGMDLDTAMATELAPLKMDRAVFETVIEPGQPGPDGHDQVSFRVATNPGAPAGPLARIASGGELSRFLLALKVCLTRDQGGLTLIFDEIDRGVGGATADAVGRRLAGLAERDQVIVVTHSPQVAAQGAHHWQVSKAVEGDATLSHVIALDDPARVQEIARMLAGDVVTPEAAAAAEALLRRQ